MDAPQWCALGAVGVGVVSLGVQITALCLNADDGEYRLLVHVGNGSAAVALGLAAAVPFL